MPTLHRERGFRFFFFSNEREKPPHVHVEFGDGLLKIWLDSLEVAQSHGFGPKETRVALAIVKARRAEFLEQWHEHLGAG